LAEIETFLKLSRKFARNSAESVPWTELVSVSAGLPNVTAQRERILDAAERILSDGRRRSTRDLLTELTRFGISPGGNNPVQNLSTYLSREKERFSTDARLGGWTVKWAATRRTGVIARGDVEQTPAGGGAVHVTNTQRPPVQSFATIAPHSEPGTWTFGNSDIFQASADPPLLVGFPPDEDSHER
jgi:hypothetical protein